MFARDGLGFMPALYLSFIDELREEEKKKIVDEKCVEQQAKMVADHPFISEKFNRLQDPALFHGPPWDGATSNTIPTRRSEVTSGKNLAKSVEAREEGNALFTMAKFLPALQKYCTAVAFAPPHEVDYSLALANRSAVLQKLNQLERSIQDIQEAEQAGYPHDKLYKLAERRGQCLVGLGRLEEGRAALLQANQLIESAGLSKEARTKFRNSLQEQLKKLANSIKRIREKESHNANSQNENNQNSNNHCENSHLANSQNGHNQNSNGQNESSHNGNSQIEHTWNGNSLKENSHNEKGHHGPSHFGHAQNGNSPYENSHHRNSPNEKIQNRNIANRNNQQEESLTTTDQDCEKSRLIRKEGPMMGEEGNVLRLMSELVSRNPLYTALHRDVSVEFTDSQGRFTVATNDIPTGTVVLSEEPLTWCVHADRTGSVCNMCLNNITVIVPCPGCVSVAYCSLACRQKAWSDHHGHECGFLGILQASGLNNFSFMALRSVARAGFTQLVEMRDESGEAPDFQHGRTADGMSLYDGAHISSGLNLVHHTNLLDVEERILRVMIAVFLAKSLRLTKFYGENKEASEADELYLTRILHTMLNACPANTHEIDTMQTPCFDRWSSLAEIKALGSGLYPTASLFNHSCNPNIMRYNIGGRLISVTCRPVKAGEELVDCYGLPWYSKPRPQRQSITTRFYNFTCCCLPCLEAWPMSDMLARSTVATINRVRCPACGQPVPRHGLETLSNCDCGAKVDLRDIPLEQIHNLTAELTEVMCVKLDWVRGLKVAGRLHALLDTHLLPPTLEHFLAQVVIWRATWTIAGNKRLVKII